jgi:hypothetical protein
VRIAIPLSAQQEAILRAVAERRGEPVDALVARALTELVERDPELLQPLPASAED